MPPFRSTSSTRKLSESSSSLLSLAAETDEPSFAGQERLLTDGRLDEAVSLALLAAFPELGVWRARCEQDRRSPDQVRVTVSLALGRSAGVRACYPLDSSRLHLASWVQQLRGALVQCVAQVYQELEAELELEPDGRAARAIARQCSLGGSTLEPLALVRHYHRRLLREGPAVLAGLDPQRGALNLLAEVEADARAELLLARELGPAYGFVQRHSYLDVPSRLYPRRLYRVRRGQRIQVLDGGRCTAELCMESGVKVPDADEFLMKLVWLRANEEQVLRVANHFPAARLLL